MSLIVAVASAYLFAFTIVRSCPKTDFLEDPNDPQAYYECGVQKLCPPGTAFDSRLYNCTKSKWDEIHSKLKHTRSKRSTGDDLKLVCYHIGWGVYRTGNGKFEPEDIDPYLCTHIIYAFSTLDKDDYVMKSSDPNTDINNKAYERVVALKKKNPNLKILIAIGGWTDSKGDKYSKLVRDSDKRKRFVKEAVSFLKKYNFDGLDLDWEYPACWQGLCEESRKDDKDDFSDLTQELRKAFDKEKPPLLLTAAVGASKYIAKRSYDPKALGKNLDFINVMTYDFHNYLDNKTGHHAAFKYDEKDPNKYDDNVVAAVKYWAENGVPKKKLIIGVPAYGRSFTLADPNNHGLYVPTIGPGEKGEFTGEPGNLAYMEIIERIVKKGWKVERDPYVGPYAYKGDQWVGYDDPTSAKEKARYARDNGYGGVMVWELAADDFNKYNSDMKSPVINALKSGLKGAGYTVVFNSWLLIGAVISLLIRRY